MMKSPIAFFDSGVGLLSVLKETKRLLPKENFVIFADQINNPYGEKSQSEIQKFAQKATKFLISNHHIKLMVLACNTATVLAIDYLRRKFKIPFIGVVPAVKPAALLSKKSRIAIMSTPATAKSRYLTTLVKNYGEDSKTLKLGCQGLEEAIEELDYNRIEKLLKKYAKKIKEFDADVVVLGCTHYPLLKPQINKILGPKIKVIDSGHAVARRIKDILQEKDLFLQTKLKDIYYTSGNPDKFSNVASSLLKYNIRAQKVF